VWHSGSAEQRLWLGSSRYSSCCPRRITHAYADGNSNGNTDSNSDAHSNRNGYIDAKREPNAHSYSHGYTETSSVAATSPHTAASPIGPGFSQLKI
jgi:hypothetical protein